MSWNLNNKQPEYHLVGSLTDELTKIFGLEVTYIKTDRQNRDEVLGDIINMSSKKDNTYKIYMYPENTASFNNRGDLLSKFGLMNFDTINLFVSSLEMQKVYSVDAVFSAVGDLILLPSDKILEITSIEHQVPGLNNLYTYGNQKNVYLLRCTHYTYNMDNIEQVDSGDIQVPNLDALFDISHQDEVKTLQDNNNPVIKERDSVFGDLG
jgi:hypothetical protein